MKDLIDVARTPAEKKAEQKRWDEPVTNQEDYPYGLRLFVDNYMIDKLGLANTDIDAGQPMILFAECIVTEDMINIVNGDKKRSMALQITKMKLAQEVDTVDAATTLYGKKA